MPEITDYIEAIFKAFLYWFSDNVVHFWKWIRPIQVVVVGQDCWWNIAGRSRELIQLDTKLMLTNRSNKPIEIIGFSLEDKKILEEFPPLILVIKGHTGNDPIIDPNTTEQVKITSFFRPVTAYNKETLSIKTIIKNSFGKDNRVFINFKPR
jgi:hypothetical protein